VFSYIVFVDFDGTVTTEDTLVGALRRSVSEDEYRERYDDLLHGRTTLSRVLREAFEKTPSAKIAEFVEYVQTVPIREGFSDFLDAMRDLGIPVVILSGGLRPMIEKRIGVYRDRILDIHGVDVDTSGTFMRLISPHDDGVELLNKEAVMRKYEYRKSICIGDSHSDISMSRASDIVFARDFLAECMEKSGRDFFRWDSFNDVTDKLKGITLA
jgi:2-hydroxy-3-keto-5-methylthiopentenyl-1-phosphate phosphatase